MMDTRNAAVAGFALAGALAVGVPPQGAVSATMTQATTRASAVAPIPVAARCYVDAVNRRNLDALVACFAPNGLVMDVDRPIRGRAAIRTWAANEVIGGRLQVLGSTPRRGGVRLLVHWAPAGSSGWRAYYTFDYRGRSITKADLQYA